MGDPPMGVRVPPFAPACIFSERFTCRTRLTRGKRTTRSSHHRRISNPKSVERERKRHRRKHPIRSAARSCRDSDDGKAPDCGGDPGAITRTPSRRSSKNTSAGVALAGGFRGRERPANRSRMPQMQRPRICRRWIALSFHAELEVRPSVRAFGDYPPCRPAGGFARGDG